MTNMNQNIVEASDFTLILCQVAHQVVFHPDALEFTTSILTDGAGWPALPAYAGAAYADHALTKTVTSDTATSAAINSDKKIQTMHNHQTVQSQQPAYPPTLTVSSRQSWWEIWLLQMDRLMVVHQLNFFIAIDGR